jgi:DNA-binding transcriptional ArsR family regulator
LENKKLFALQADVCKALGHPLRIEIIEILQNQELCFTDILEITGGLKSNLSQHLSSMTKKGILKVRREGQCNYFSITSPKVAQACLLMREVLIENIKNQQLILQNL